MCFKVGARCALGGCTLSWEELLQVGSVEPEGRSQPAICPLPAASAAQACPCGGPQEEEAPDQRPPAKAGGAEQEGGRREGGDGGGLSSVTFKVG